MPTAWKAFETRVARLFHGHRRGPDTSDADGGKCDIVCERWSPECKLLSRPSWSDILSAVAQSERNANGKIPVAILKKKHQDDAKALVVMSLESFEEHMLR